MLTCLLAVIWHTLSDMSYFLDTLVSVRMVTICIYHVLSYTSSFFFARTVGSSTIMSTKGSSAGGAVVHFSVCGPFDDLT